MIPSLKGDVNVLSGLKNNVAVLGRRSVLDYVLDDWERLSSRVGRVDRARLDQHLTSIRELERQVALAARGRGHRRRRVVGQIAAGVGVL